MRIRTQHERELAQRIAELEAAISSAARTAEKVDRQLANVEGERNHLFSKNEDLVARVAELEAERDRHLDLLTRAIKWVERIDLRREYIRKGFFDNDTDPHPLVNDIRAALAAGKEEPEP